MAYKYNPFTGTLDLVNNKITSGGGITIPEYSTDPVSPNAEDAWVLRSGSGGAIVDGTPIGLLLCLTYQDNAGVAYSYLLKYRTKENTTLSVALT